MTHSHHDSISSQPNCVASLLNFDFYLRKHHKLRKPLTKGQSLYINLVITPKKGIRRTTSIIRASFQDLRTTERFRVWCTIPIIDWQYYCFILDASKSSVIRYHTDNTIVSYWIIVTSHGTILTTLLFHTGKFCVTLATSNQVAYWLLSIIGLTNRIGCFVFKPALNNKAGFLWITCWLLLAVSELLCPRKRWIKEH